MDIFNNIASWIANPIGSVQGIASGSSGGTIWNHGDNYRVSSLGESANEFSGTGMDPNGFVAGLYNDLTGVTAQSREFAQQEYLQDKQNEYNRPINEMKRMIEAGINPNTAASGIAGNGSPSASPSQVASNAGGVAQGVQSVASGLASASQFGVNKSIIDENEARADNLKEQTAYISKNFSFQTAVAIGELASKLVGIGVPELEAAVIAFDLGQGGYDKALEYLKGFQGLRQYDEKMKILDSEKQMKLKELNKYDDIINASISKDKAQAARDQKEAAKLEIETWFETERKKIIEEIPALLFEGNNQLLYLLETYGSDSDIYKNVQRMIMDTNFSRMSGELMARVEYAYNIAFDEWKAKNDVDASFARYYQRVEAIGKIMVECYKSFFENPKSIQGGIMKYLDQIYEQLRDLDPDVSQRKGFGFVNNASMPKKGHPKRNPYKPWE